MNRTGPTNEHLQQLIMELRELSREKNVLLWKRIADDLERPSRNRRSVNIYKIDQYTRDGEIALVPGKVLSVGSLTKKLTVAAFQFSQEAREKINGMGKAITIHELVRENPAGKNVRIIG
ncbi:50S ribosomal protein L18e [Candidatus Woesearchaeota archaeon]|nr:50S ribosomal protein L18e [Candidatus Woesearchaeota archaeon]